jgi:hypothetical protein
MALQTALGLGPRGFFMPYRYAASARPATGYPEIGAAFDARRADFASLMDSAARHRPAFDAFTGPPPAPRWDQAWFPPLDAAIAYTLVAETPPARNVEVGSGHSTRFLTAAAAPGTTITCIDPAPRAALENLPVTWERTLLSDAHLPLFDGLRAGDIAFFDSSHLMWPGLDVDLILNRILPRLAPGVRVHIHDIFLPDPYPDSWEWRGYTEQNALGGWLMGGGFAPLFASHYAATRMDALAHPAIAGLPRHPEAIDTSLWMVKNPAP